MALQIAKAVCVGKNKCTLQTHSTYSFKNASGSVLTGSIHGYLTAGVNATSSGSCLQNSSDLRLIIKAECYATSITIGKEGNHRQVKKDTMAMVAIMVDCAGCVIFMLGVLWLQQREAEAVEIEDANSVSITDYTVWVKQLPEHKNFEDLSARLIEFFNTRLNTKDACRLARMERGTAAALKHVEVRRRLRGEG
jgi:hypothetical protein